jgi:hypothetical protein
MSFVNAYFNLKVRSASDQFLSNFRAIGSHPKGYVHFISRNGIACPTILDRSFFKKFSKEAQKISDISFKFYYSDVFKGQDLVCFLALHEFARYEEIYKESKMTSPNPVECSLKDFKFKLLKYMSFDVFCVPAVREILNVKSLFLGDAEEKKVDRVIQNNKKEMEKNLLSNLRNDLLKELEKCMKGKGIINDLLSSLLNPVLMQLEIALLEGNQQATQSPSIFFLHHLLKKVDQTFSRFDPLTLDLIKDSISKTTLSLYFQQILSHYLKHSAILSSIQSIRT